MSEPRDDKGSPINLTLYRDSKGADSTIGSLWLGEGMTAYHFCDTCEDEQRSTKVAGKTRIPAGRYEIKKRYDSPMAKRYDDSRARIGHKGMLWLQDVSGFEWVYIHIGNSHEDTNGCVLVGFSRSIDHIHGGGTIGRSVEAYEALYPIVSEALESGEQVFITVNDEGVR